MNTMRKVALLFVIVCIVLSSGFSESKKVIILGTVENLPPFSYYEDGVLKGIDIEVINELAKRTNLELTIKTLPWIRVISQLQAGTIDGAFSVYDNEERKKFCTYIDVVHYDNLGIVVRKEKLFNYFTIHDMYGKKVGINSGVYVTKEFEMAVANGNIIVEDVNDSEMTNVQKLFVNRIDAVIGVVETMLYSARQLGYTGEIVSIEKKIEVNRPGYLVLSNKAEIINDSNIRIKLSGKINEIMNDGTYEKILKKYSSIR